VKRLSAPRRGVRTRQAPQHLAARVWAAGQNIAAKGAAGLRTVPDVTREGWFSARQIGGTTAWRREIVLQAAGMWLATRVAAALVTFFAVTLSAVRPGSFGPDVLLARWDRFDVNWYLMIARYGYWTPTAATYARDTGQMPTAFFPLYPLLIKAGTLLFGFQHEFLIAMIIANLGTLAAFIAVGLFAAAESGTSAGHRTVLVFAAYPMAFFLTAAYTEGIFVALAVFCLYCARRGAWWAAAALAFFAGLTRFTGVILILPLAWEWGRQHHWWSRGTWIRGRWKQRLRPSALGQAVVTIGAAPAALGLYMLYLWRRFADPLSFVHAAEANWYHKPLPPWGSISLAIHGLTSVQPWSYQQALVFLDLGALVIAAVLTLAVCRRVPVAFTLYLVGLLYLCVSSPATWTPDVWVSSARYLLPAAPLFLLLARWTQRRPMLEAAIIGGGFMLQAMLLTLWLTTNAYIT
jgi:hypothetical protein